jgi:hypothetical protein
LLLSIDQQRIRTCSRINCTMSSSSSSRTASGSSSPIVPRAILFRLSRGRIGVPSDGGGPEEPGGPGGGSDLVLPESFDQFQTTLKVLEDKRLSANFDPTPHLCTLAQLLEKVCCNVGKNCSRLTREVIRDGIHERIFKGPISYMRHLQWGFTNV